ncbi:MAG: TIGR03087 family PEP-CTERM/XrtA system glycosyltransferase [Planctomycetes bacterium]|nr:TIGR03087 family PEP-CTERM/XrtA system glycosyltransferase [Planctomycetota bacterium]
MRICYLCHRIPFPPDKGDKIRSFHQVEFLARRHEVDLFTFVDDAADLAHVAALRRMVRRIHVERLWPLSARLWSLRALLGGGPLSFAYFRQGRLRAALQRALRSESYDLAVAFSSAMAPYLDGWDGPRALDFVDIDSAKWLAYAEQLGRTPLGWLYGREGRALRRLEGALAERAELTVVCSPREEEELCSFCAPRCAVTVPNGTDVERFSPGESPLAPLDLVFTGAMDYRANADAVLWFAREVLPLVRKERPAARFAIVGSNPGPAVLRLGRLPGVEVTGRVPDVCPYLRAAAVAVAPLRVARGIQNKVLEALACGTPVVATRAALGGIGEARGVLACETPEEQAAAVLCLLADPARRAALGAEGRAFVVERFRWEVRLEELDALLRVAACR